MNGKKAKILRHLARNASVGLPLKKYTTHHKGHVLMMAPDESGERKQFVYPDEVRLGESERRTYQSLKKEYKRNSQFKKGIARNG